MPKARTVFILLVTVFLAACQNDARFRTAGAGPELYAPEVATNTAETIEYFNLLCARAGLVEMTPAAGCNRSNWRTEYWRVLVAAGFNDIDRRCDNYLGWLLAKRNERLFTNQTLAALTGLLGGLTVATGAADAIGYAGLALGLGTTMYNAYQETLLNGLETATIIKTVEARRLQFRTNFQHATIVAQPDAEYVLRTYLRICTPASIIMDANTAMILVSSGQRFESPQIQQMEEQRKALLGYTPPTPATPVTQIPRRGTIRTPEEVGTVFKVPATTTQLQHLQAALCVPQAERGKPGPNTIANINLWRTGSESAGSNVNVGEKIDSKTYARILQETGGGDCNLSRYRNVYENWNFRAHPEEEARLLKELHGLFPGETTTSPKSFSESGARDLIGRARTKCGLDNTKGPFVDQVTPDLQGKLDSKQCGGS